MDWWWNPFESRELFFPLLLWTASLLRIPEVWSLSVLPKPRKLIDKLIEIEVRHPAAALPAFITWTFYFHIFGTAPTSILETFITKNVDTNLDHLKSPCWKQLSDILHPSWWKWVDFSCFLLNKLRWISSPRTSDAISSCGVTSGSCFWESWGDSQLHRVRLKWTNEQVPRHPHGSTGDRRSI